MPDFSLELYARNRCGGPVAGIDEAGRGPWAGPVVAAAVVLSARCIPDGIDDSKKLAAPQREALYARLQDCAFIGIGQASVAEIDRLNILGATKLAMQRALAALAVTPALALVDGNQPPALPCDTRCVVGGDATVLSIAAAGIVAKVTRDRLMAELHAEFPSYGFGHNMGYGTKHHQRALREHGVTAHHRTSFAPIRELLSLREAA